MKIGISLESFNLPLRRALLEAERLGIGGVRFNAVGDLAPANLSQSGRRELRHLLKVHHLDLTSVGCPLRHGLDVAENLEPRLEHVKQVMGLAFDLGPRIITLQAGTVASSADDARLGLLREALTVLGMHGDRIGTLVALEAGLESGEVLANFLNPLDTGSLGVNFDPANLLMNGFRPFEDLRAVIGRIVQVQAKDVRRHGPSRTAQEVPLGHGDIDWMGLLELLGEADYRGWVVLVRETGTQRLKDIQDGVGVLRRLIGEGR
jgi:sugar phosphate isomerase/epimerase